LIHLPEQCSNIISLACWENELSYLPEGLRDNIILYSNGNKLPEIYMDESIPEYIWRVNVAERQKSKARTVERCGKYFEEMMEVAWHPSRVKKWLLAGINFEDM
jgi:hypothetical protein